jgi:hypothetical protein
LENLLSAQPEGFPKIAAALPTDPALVVYAANMRLTPEFREGLLLFTERYAEVMQQMFGSAGQPNVSWFTHFFGEQARLSEQQLECMRGDMAGHIDFGREVGFRLIQVGGVPRDESCDGLVEAELSATAELVGPDEEPWVSVTDPALVHRGVRGLRVDLDLDRLLPDESEGDAAQRDALKGMMTWC